ncbi:helix-turn-helix domain-containing protein [Nocardia sp. CS682]|uniref:helix-turn-helix domain-containing protein n=1 Tax=Nocardia sp. CS682 TaxID=1047172 RepID=UPI00351A0A9E
MRRHPSTVRDLLKRCGGVRPIPRHRGRLRLSLAEREEISRGLAAGDSLRGIARRLGRAPSTISREVAGRGGRFAYRALPADQAAWARATRPKPTKHRNVRSAVRPHSIPCGRDDHTGRTHDERRRGDLVQPAFVPVDFRR